MSAPNPSKAKRWNPPLAPPTKTQNSFITCHAAKCKASFARKPAIPSPQIMAEHLLIEQNKRINSTLDRMAVGFGVQSALLLIAFICLFASKN